MSPSKQMISDNFSNLVRFLYSLRTYCSIRLKLATTVYPMLTKKKLNSHKKVKELTRHIQSIISEELVDMKDLIQKAVRDSLRRKLLFFNC
eukprot:UN30218